MTIGRTPGVQGSNSGRRKEEEVKLVWEARNINQTDPTPQLQNLSREEIIPGERALLEIVRSTIKPKKHRDPLQCLHVYIYNQKELSQARYTLQ